MLRHTSAGGGPSPGPPCRAFSTPRGAEVKTDIPVAPTASGGPTIDDIAAFLRATAPFDLLDADELARVVEHAEVVRASAGETVLDPHGGEPSRHAFVVMEGAIELLAAGRLQDLVGEGEMFGYASMLTQEPVGYVARAPQDSVLLRIPEDVLRPVLQRPEAVPFLVRSVAGTGHLLAGSDPRAAPPGTGQGRPVSALMRPPLLCGPGVAVREAAQLMGRDGAACILVDARDGLGIVTDRDLRTRVVAAGAGPDTPLAQVMTTPVVTIDADRLAEEAFLDMLDHGVRHLVVLDARRRVVGVLDDVDLMAAERRAPFLLRTQIARARDVPGAAGAAARLPATVVALHDAGVGALAISRVIASIHDTLVRRLVELVQEDLGPAPVPFAWIALGSYGRREPFPGSDGDSAIAWDGPEDPEVSTALRAIAERVIAGMSAAGIRPCPEGAVASSSLFARSAEGWERAAEGWLADPDRDRGLTLLAVAVEGETVTGHAALTEHLARAVAASPGREATLRRLAIVALGRRPPTGFLRNLVLERGGGRRGVLDIKEAGVGPVVDLARWAALSAGVTAASTGERLRAAAEQGTIDAGDAALLGEAFELVCALRMEHQVERIRSGLAPDDLIDPSRLTPITRRGLREAFRAITRVQRGIAVGLGVRAR
jgi:CBS domain-containing protein